jgi:hypothetical protein
MMLPEMERLIKHVGGRDTSFGPNDQFYLSVECRNPDIPARVIDKNTGYYMDIFAFYQQHNWHKCKQEKYRDVRNFCASLS